MVTSQLAVLVNIKNVQGIPQYFVLPHGRWRPFSPTRSSQDRCQALKNTFTHWLLHWEHMMMIPGQLNGPHYHQYNPAHIAKVSSSSRSWKPFYDQISGTENIHMNKSDLKMTHDLSPIPHPVPTIHHNSNWFWIWRMRVHVPQWRMVVNVMLIVCLSVCRSVRDQLTRLSSLGRSMPSQHQPTNQEPTVFPFFSGFSLQILKLKEDDKGMDGNNWDGTLTHGTFQAEIQERDKRNREQEERTYVVDIREEVSDFGFRSDHGEFWAKYDKGGLGWIWIYVMKVLTQDKQMGPYWCLKRLCSWSVPGTFQEHRP